MDSYNFSLSDSDVGNSLKTLQFDLYLLPQRPQKTATSPPTKIAEVERAWVKTSSLNTSITVSQNLILHTPIFCAGVFAFFSEGRSNPINIWSVLNGAVHVLNWCHFVDMHLLKKNCVLSTKAKENCQKYNKLEFLLSPLISKFSLKTFFCNKLYLWETWKMECYILSFTLHYVILISLRSFITRNDPKLLRRRFAKLLLAATDWWRARCARNHGKTTEVMLSSDS